MGIILGVDIGSGVKSATGLAFFDPVGMTFETKELRPDDKRAPANERLRNLASKFSSLILTEGFSIIAFESFVMKGKGGETLARLIGALMAATTDEKIVEIANTKIKQIIGGNGRSEKEEVANGLEAYFMNKNRASADKVRALKIQQAWDSVDALAIAVSAYLLETKKE